MIRLTGDVGRRDVLDVEVPMITIPVAPGPQPRGPCRSGGAQSRAEEQGHRSRADLHRPPGAPAAPAAAMVTDDRADARRPDHRPADIRLSRHRQRPFRFRQDRRAAHARRPRLLLRGQPAGGADAGSCVQAISQGGTAGAPKLAVGVDVRNRADEPEPRCPAILAELAAVGDRVPADLPRHARRRADQALFGNAPPPPAVGRRPRPRRGDRARNAACCGRCSRSPIA